MEQHPTSVLEQLEGWLDQGGLLPVHGARLLRQVGQQKKSFDSQLISQSLDFSNGVELAKALAEEGASVFGWDLEWNMNYNINRLHAFYTSDVTKPSYITLKREAERDIR